MKYLKFKSPSGMILKLKEEREVNKTMDNFAEERNLYKVSEDELGKYLKAYNGFEAIVEKELKIRGEVKEPESMERLEFLLEMTEYDLKMGKENKEPLEDILWYKHEINKLKHAISSLKQKSLDKENKSDSFINNSSEKFMKLRTRLRNKLKTLVRFSEGIDRKNPIVFL